MNDSLKAHSRRYKKNIVISGMGAIVLCSWDIIKFVMSVILDEGAREELFGMSDMEVVISPAIIAVMIAFFFAFYIAFSLFIGIGAMRYGNGKSKNKLFILFAVIQLISTIAGIGAYFKSPEQGGSTDTSAASFLLDMTIVLVISDMIFSTIMSEIIDKKARKIVGEG